MLELPHSMRDLLVEQLDDYCEKLDDTSDTDAIAEAIVEMIEAVGQEVTAIEAEEIVSQLEASGELDASLVEVLEEAFATNSGFDYTGDEIVTLIAKLCEIDWLDADEEDDAGFFGTEVEQEEDF